MPYALQMLRALIEAHPDRAAPLRVHVDALEATITNEPSRCLERVRALFEATHLTIAPQLGVVFAENDEFQARNSMVFKALDFALDGHPDSERVDKTIKKLVGSINGRVGALAELSNIPGMRHGGSLDWSTLRRQHALMLGGLCDTLVSFLFDAAWTRASAKAAISDQDRYEDYDAFNDSIDDEFGDFEVAGSMFPASRILFSLDPIQYENARAQWAAEQLAADQDEGTAA
jgi:Abortive infection C-terminus